MKKSITLVLAMATAVAMGQYNRTYDINGNADFLEPSFVITNAQAQSIAVSIAYDAPGVPRTDYFIITKTDCDGNVIYNNRIYNNNTPTDGMTHVEALVETRAGDLLIAGYHYDDQQHIQQPMVVKVNAAGNLLMKRIYYMNQMDIFGSEINKISLCRVFNDPPQFDNYFVVASSDSNNDPGNSVVVSVTKIDANLNWINTRKYYFGSDFQTVRDYPGDIEYSPIARMYMITGYRHEIGNGVRQDRMFFFGIDNNMNISTPGIKTLISKSIPVDQDMVYDPNTRDFAVTFTHNKNGYVPTANSIMGFLRIDPALTVIPGTPRAYWHANGIEHNSRSISRSANGNYVICSGIFDPNTNTHNPAWLKVTNAGAALAPLMRYNILDDVYFGHHAVTFNCNTGAEEFVLVNEQKTDLREIRTDANGKVCGNRDYQPQMLSYTPQEKIYPYNIKDGAKEVPYDPFQKMLDPKVRDCTPPGNSYRPAVATSIDQLNNEANELALYPSVLSADNARLTLVNNSSEAIKIEMHNLAGQLIYSNSNMATGTSEVQLNVNGGLSEGVYLVKFYNAKGALNTATKIIVTK